MLSCTAVPQRCEQPGRNVHAHRRWGDLHQQGEERQASPDVAPCVGRRCDSGTVLVQHGDCHAQHCGLGAKKASVFVVVEESQVRAHSGPLSCACFRSTVSCRA